LSCASVALFFNKKAGVPAPELGEERVIAFEKPVYATIGVAASYSPGNKIAPPPRTTVF